MFDPVRQSINKPSITAIDANVIRFVDKKNRFTWGLGPYLAHRLFNPFLPLSMETGIELEAGYQITNGLKISGNIRKSLLTNLTDNDLRSDLSYSVYTLTGHFILRRPKCHIPTLKLSYPNIAPAFAEHMLVS